MLAPTRLVCNAPVNTAPSRPAAPRVAWIKVLEYDDLDGGNTENSIEKVTICYQYLDFLTIRL